MYGAITLVCCVVSNTSHSHILPHYTTPPTHTPTSNARPLTLPEWIFQRPCISCNARSVVLPFSSLSPAVQVSIYKPATASSFDQRFYYICLSYIGADALPPGFLRRLTSHCSRFTQYMCTGCMQSGAVTSYLPHNSALPVVEELMVGSYCTCSVDSVCEYTVACNGVMVWLYTYVLSTARTHSAFRLAHVAWCHTTQLYYGLARGCWPEFAPVRVAVGFPRDLLCLRT